LGPKFPLVNFDYVPTGNWWHNSKSEDRVTAFRKWLAARPEKNILVVTHREYMRSFIGEHFGWRFTECGAMERQMTGTKCFASSISILQNNIMK
jgi:hypothetical protein